jgi:small subunit ribosomal protein S21
MAPCTDREACRAAALRGGRNLETSRRGHTTQTFLRQFGRYFRFLDVKQVLQGICWYLCHSGRVGGVFYLAEVRVQEGEPLENALRRFKRKVQTEDIIKEVKRHSFYLKPGEKKRVKEALARKRNRKKVRKEQE